MTVMSKKPRKTANPWPKTLAGLRDALGLTQAEAAAKIDVPIGTWRNWEQGRRRPSPAIARLLWLTFPEFFEKSQ